LANPPKKIQDLEYKTSRYKIVGRAFIVVGNVLYFLLKIKGYSINNNNIIENDIILL